MLNSHGIDNNNKLKLSKCFIKFKTSGEHKIKPSMYVCSASHQDYSWKWSLLTTAWPTMTAIACEIERIENQMIRFWLYFAALACL